MKITASMKARHEAEMRALGRGADLEGQDFNEKFRAAEASVIRAGLPPYVLTETLQAYATDVCLTMACIAQDNLRQGSRQQQIRYQVTASGCLVPVHI